MNSQPSYSSTSMTPSEAAMMLNSLANELARMAFDQYNDPVEHATTIKVTTWENLKAQVCSHLEDATVHRERWHHLMIYVEDLFLNMHAGERHNRALEMQMLAVSQMGKYCQRLSGTMPALSPVEPFAEPNSGQPHKMPGAFAFVPVSSTSSADATFEMSQEVAIHSKSTGYQVMDSFLYPSPMKAKGTKDSTPGSIKAKKSRVASKWSDIHASIPAAQASPKKGHSSTSKAKVSKAKVSKALSKKGSKRSGSRATKPAIVDTEALVDVSHPTELDVLAGRGGGTNIHVGNMLFREEARKLRKAHQNSTRNDKFLISQELVDRVQSYGGRFLKKSDDGTWVEMKDSDARKKAAQALRDTKWVAK